MSPPLNFSMVSRLCCLSSTNFNQCHSPKPLSACSFRNISRFLHLNPTPLYFIYALLDSFSPLVFPLAFHEIHSAFLLYHLTSFRRAILRRRRCCVRCSSRMSMWILYGCFIVTFFYLLTVTNIFDTNKSIHDFIRFSRVKNPRYYDTSLLRNTDQNQQSVLDDGRNNALQDIFDTCPFVAPDPWDPEILNYIEVKYGFFNNCTVNERWAPITELRNGRVRILRAGSARKYECRARCVNYLDEEHIAFDPWKDIDDPNPFLCDFVQTECTSRKRTLSYIHMQIAEMRTKSVHSAFHPNVHIILIDSVASSQAIRALPRTVNFLTNAMGAVQFRKFNKVGANSRPNGFVMLFGKTTEPVMREMVDQEPIPADWTYSTYCRKYLDESVYIPVQYRNAGYKTFGAQDYSASLLNFPNCVGLEKREFQHSYRPFDLLITMDRKLKIAHEMAPCLGSHNNMLKYLEKFLNSYKGSSKFSLSWVTKLAHDDTGRLYKGDNDLYNFFVKNRQEVGIRSGK